MTSGDVKSLYLISVVVCTRNRADLLRKAVASIVGQQFPKEKFEIVVVDNGSSDHTGLVATEFNSQANVLYLREDRIGLCVARNTGWEKARGRYVVFFDDDAIAQPGWLDAVAEAFEHSSGTVGVIGGRVDPVWLGPRPDWLADEIAGALTILDRGPQQKFITDARREWLVGANMAAPKAVLAEVGGFHPWLDRVGSNLLSSGDVYLQMQIIRRGYKCLYVPKMAIQHLAPPSRLTQAWFTKRFYWQGMSDAVMQIIQDCPSKRHRLQLAIRRLAQLATSPKRVKALSFPTSDPAIFREKCLALIDLGYAAGILGAAGR